MYYLNNKLLGSFIIYTAYFAVFVILLLYYFYISAFSISVDNYYLYITKNDNSYLMESLKYEQESKSDPPYKENDLLLPSLIDYKIKRNIRRNEIKNISVVIAILSSPHHYRKRYSFRLLYNKLNNIYNSRIIFFIGSSSFEKDKILQTELNLFNDVVQFAFHNSYFNLTILSIMAIKYCYANFKDMKFYIKTDDDMIINYKLLYKLIIKSDPHARVVYGHLGGGTKTIRNVNDRNYIPYEQFKCNYLPKYVYGGLIVMSYVTLKEIYNHTLYNQSYIWREDINLGAMCTLYKCNIRQFPHKIDISINSNTCILSNSIIASEYKRYNDAFYCIN